MVGALAATGQATSPRKVAARMLVIIAVLMTTTSAFPIVATQPKDGKSITRILKHKYVLKVHVSLKGFN